MEEDCSPMKPVEPEDQREKLPAQRISNKVRSILVTVATVLIIITYIEDGARIIYNWKYQKSYVVRKGYTPALLASPLLLYTSVVQLLSILLAVPVHLPKLDLSVLGWQPIKIPPEMGLVVIAECVALTGSILIQPLMYAQLSNTDFLCMSIAQLGALALLACEALPKLTPMYIDVTTQFLDQIKLAARVLLTTDFFVVFTLHLLFSADTKRWDDRYIQGVVHFIAAGLIWAGYRTLEVSCVVAALALIDTIIRFPYWTEKSGHNRDYVMFLFFHSLSMVGGMLLLAASGPGKISVDASAKKKM